MMKKLYTILVFLGFLLPTFAFTVVLDAGHGGHDAGAVGSFSKEKNINLRYTLLVGDMIKKNIPDAKVIYTRDKDVFVDLNERARIANRNKADLFVSIHTNSSKNSKANGMETFTLGVSRSKENMEVAMLENSVIKLEEDYETKYEGFDPNSVDSYIMFEFMKDQYTDRSITCADFVQTKMINASKRNDRGVRQAGFLVLRATSMPSILIELGFISNKEEEKYLNNNENQVKLATAIFNGIKEYKHELDKKSGNSNSEELEVRNEELKNDATVENKVEIKTENTENINVENKDIKAKGEIIPNSSFLIPNSNDIEFFIQYLVSKNNYKADNAVFKGHAPTKVLNENNLYKYLIGPYDVNTVFNKRNEITKDFPDAFIVAYKEGKKVSTPEAIQEAKDKLK
ncbi:MAG: N-acetylmuramoyl-L-alanine amidase [Paludibacteraceae bacterium]|nr:N-acetylmuramoyl-L-alanine amidase [Paludibacteraceae bacterium]